MSRPLCVPTSRGIAYMRANSHSPLNCLHRYLYRVLSRSCEGDIA